uniref:FP protein C-terminal domain-containing protein n=2 Tax=Cacopsylla melanoneura TaxID=428564 RepID=A0A8D8Z3K0_9HEMI
MEESLKKFMKEEIVALEGRMTAMFQSCLKEENEKMKEMLKKQEDIIMKQGEENRELKIRVNDLEQYSRRSNIQINNIPSSSEESVETIVCEMGQAIGVPINFGVDIQAAHRVPTQGSSAKPIIVKFTNRQLRNRFIVEAKKSKPTCAKLDCTKNLLFASNTKIYVNDHLSPENKKLLFEARNCVRNKSAKSAWSKDGKIFIKRNETAAPVTIRDIQDLQTFQSSFSSTLQS